MILGYNTVINLRKKFHMQKFNLLVKFRTTISSDVVIILKED